MRAYRLFILWCGHLGMPSSVQCFFRTVRRRWALAPPAWSTCRSTANLRQEVESQGLLTSSGMVCSDDLAGLRVCDRSSKVKAFSSYPARSAPTTLQGGASFSSLWHSSGRFFGLDPLSWCLFAPSHPNASAHRLQRWRRARLRLTSRKTKKQTWIRIED